ncbi:MAG: DsbA family protein [Hyphomicrobiales bacterium]
MITPKFSKLTKFLMAGCAVLFLTTASPVAFSEEFSESQKKEIGEIVREYLLKNPTIMREVFSELERIEAEEREKLAKAGILESKDALFRSNLSYVAGNPEGDVTMVEFFDYNCGYCKRAFPDVMKLIDSDPNLRVVIKEFPILGAGSVFAARAAIASKKQDKYWEFHTAMMNARGSLNESRVINIAKKLGLDVDKLREDMEADVVRQEIAESHTLANRMGINGTPAFVIDDRLVPGALGYAELRKQIFEVRDAGGCKVC